MSGAIRAFLAEIERRGPGLFRLGLAHLALFVVLLLMMAFDDRQVTGVNVWLKPAKFALSIGVYMLTLAWLTGELKRLRPVVFLVALLAGGAMLAEQVLITLQAARGVTSHYNVATPFDTRVFQLMGQGVIVNSLAIAALLALFLFAHRDPRRPAYVWGIRLGLLLFLAGSAQGMIMIFNSAHTIGAVDGGPGLPFVNWSTQAGDLRTAHFIGIHALQALPIAGWLIDRWLESRSARLLALGAVATGYAALALGAHLIALAGRPIL